MTDFERYVEACNYPGKIAPRSVKRHLQEYLAALNVKRRVVQIQPGWELSDYPDMLDAVKEVLDKTAALAARAARDALAARDARDARAARDARDALAALDARDALAALDALAARDARDARAARDALAARDARDALDARDARDARDALAARAALDARDARDARALDRFACWCIQSGGWYWWNWELSLIATEHLGAAQLGKSTVDAWAKPLFDAYCAGAWFLFWTGKTLYWIAKPGVHVEIANGMRRLHNAEGAAIESDVENLYYWHGVEVPAFVIIRPDWITLKHISTEENAEVRRVLIERYDSYRYQGAYLHDAGAEEISRDEFGILYRKDVPGDEPILMVRLLNRTPEPDGILSADEACSIFGQAASRVQEFGQNSRWKEYYKRVHPECRPMYGNDLDGHPVFGNPQALTAKAAVASTRGLYAEQYYPEHAS